ncbi:MAG: imidazolonepropionase [Bacteroidota bacterium]|nr:imidazolonepropionase [Bacteroidota bacterium]MDP4204856.1 imidazolonepropionase [Bacteroidota bacterium]
MEILLLNIRQLVQIEDQQPVEYRAGKDMLHLPLIADAYLHIANGVIQGFGKMHEIPDHLLDAQDDRFVIDCTGKLVFPSFCDSHTHIVYAGSREMEFVDKIKGMSYEEIAQRGGGILNSAQRLHQTSEEELFDQTMIRINEISRLGTGAVEIKSGYGLSPEDEIKILRVIKRLKKESDLTIRSTFLGAHAIPAQYKENPSEYVDLIINEMIPVVASEELADFIDVFCEKGFFSVEDTDRILMAGMKYGMRPKIHANELSMSGGVPVGVKYNALSVDHLDYMDDKDIDCLKNTETMPTVLPGASFFLSLPLAPVRKMIDAGLPVALASDFNPGSSPSGNMKFVQSLGCIKYKMLPEEVINATTINSAYAMGLSSTHGTIAVGKVANVFITRPIPGYEYFPYAFGSDLIEITILNGEIH